MTSSRSHGLKMAEADLGPCPFSLLCGYVKQRDFCTQIIKIKIATWALAGVAQWIEHGPVNQRVAGSIPSQSTYLG